MTNSVKTILALIALVVPFALMGCGSGEPEVDSNVPVTTQLDPNGPKPAGFSGAGGGAKAGGGAPQTPGTE